MQSFRGNEVCVPFLLISRQWYLIRVDIADTMLHEASQSLCAAYIFLLSTSMDSAELGGKVH